MRKKITLDGLLATLAFAVVVGYLVNPQLVAGALWHAVLTAVNFWAVS